MPIAVPLAIAGAGVAGAAISSNASKSAANTQAAASDRAAQYQNQQFQQMLQLAMPGYNRAEGAAGVYGQALGLPSMTTPQPQQPAGGFGGGQPGLMTRQAGAGLQARMGADRAQPLGGQANIGQGGAPAPQQVPAGVAPLNIADQVRNTPGYQAQLDQGIKAIDRAAPLVGGMYSGRRMKALEAEGQNTFGSFYNDWLNRVGGIAGQAPQIAQNVGQAGMQNANNVGNLWMTGANARAQGSLNSASAWSGALGNMAGMAGGYWG